jgi:hypothetical protein
MSGGIMKLLRLPIASGDNIFLFTPTFLASGVKIWPINANALNQFYDWLIYLKREVWFC